MNDAAENTVACTQTRERFDDLVGRAAKHKERLVLTRRGKPVAAIIPIEDLNLLEAIADQLDAEEFQRAKEKFEGRGEPAIPWADVKAELGL